MGTKGESGVVFPIELRYYICKFVSDALNLELEFKRMNVQPYVARRKFDNRDYEMEHLNVDSHFCHEPQLDDYWENYSDVYEVRKRLWSRFILQQITTLRLPVNISGVQKI